MRDRVKCAKVAPRPSVVRAGLRTFSIALVAAGFSGQVGAQVLFGGGLGPKPPKGPAPLDPALPTGAVRYAPPRPLTASEPGACSTAAHVCVHRTAGVDENAAMTWLYAMERAEARLTIGLGLGGFVPDGERGGSSALDLYLVRGSAEGQAHLDAVDVGRSFDSASAYCTAGAAYPDVDRAATMCAAEAVAFRIDAAATPFSRRSLAASLWHQTGVPTSNDVTAADDVQANPERAIVARERSRFADGASLFFDYLDAARGRTSGAVGLAAYVLASRKPSAPGLRFDNEPDVIDVLRATFGPTPTDVARVYGDFAVARAFVGARDADGAFPTLAWTGRAGRVRFEWSVPFSSLPRLLSPSRPVEPTGATYLWVSMDGDPGTQSFVFGADWEPPVAFRWAIVLVARDGSMVRRVDVPFVERETHVERVVSDLGGAAGILIAGTNMGGISPTYPFDPDFEPYEPHAYSVHLARQ